MMKPTKRLQNVVHENFNHVGWGACIPAIVILVLFGIFFIFRGGNFHTTYTQIQIPLFLELNQALSAFPSLEYNLTNIGNALVGLSLLSIFLYYAPRLWGALINASLLSLIVAGVLKAIFRMPRPASVIELSDFTIIGRTLYSKSFPSGHSITIFIFVTLLLLAFVSWKHSRSARWLGYTPLFVVAGLFIAASRVACGAHWPLDVLTGSAIGYLLAIAGVKIDNRYPLWRWMGNNRYTWILLVIVLTLLVLMIQKVITSSLLIIDLLAILSLLTTAILFTIKLCSKKI